MGVGSPLDSDLAQGRLHLQHQRWEQALFAFGRAIAADASCVEAWIGRAAAFVQLQRLADASAALDEAYRLAPHDPTVKKAIEQLARVGLPQVPAVVRQSASERRQRGDAWMAQGRVIDALREYDEALLLDPGDAEAQAGRVAAMKNIDLGVASIYRNVQGLSAEEANAEQKREMLKNIFESNVALRAQLTSLKG